MTAGAAASRLPASTGEEKKGRKPGGGTGWKWRPRPSPHSTRGPPSARVAPWGGGGVADLQPLHVARRAERAGLQARLRSLFSAPGWGKRLEPRTRYGEPFLPALPALARQDLGEARGLLRRVDALSL